MVASNCKTVLNNISAFNRNNFQLNKKYLWVWNPTSIPPHMGLSAEGSYFSLKSNGVDYNAELNDLIGVIERKQLPVLAIELKADFDVARCQAVFSQFERTIPHQVTCLRPIKTVLNFDEAQKLSELIEALEQAQSLGEITGWNINQSSIELPEYSTADIHAHLDSLSN